MVKRVLLSLAFVAGLSSLAHAQCSGSAGVPFNCASGGTPGALDSFLGGSNSGANTVRFTGLQVATGVYAMASAISGGGTTNFLRADGTWAAPPSGTVTVVSGGAANGLTVTVANGSTTPSISVAITATGILKSNGTTTSAATAGTDYLSPTGSGAGLTGLTYGQMPALAANQLLGALTATTPSGLTLPSCSGGSNALIWTLGVGFGCNTISGSGAAAAGSLTGTTLASNVVSSSLTSAAGGAFGTGAYATIGNLTDSGTTLISASTVTIPSSYAIALFDPTSNAIGATIQPCNGGSKWDQDFKDTTGQAAAHAITITPSAGTIDGSAFATIGTAHGALHVHSNGNVCVIL